MLSRDKGDIREDGGWRQEKGQVQPEGEGRALPEDAPEDRRGGRGAAPDRRTRAEHRNRDSQQGGGGAADRLQPLPRRAIPLRGLLGAQPGPQSASRPRALEAHPRSGGAPEEGALRSLRLLPAQRADAGQRYL